MTMMEVRRQANPSAARKWTGPPVLLPLPHDAPIAPNAVAEGGDGVTDPDVLHLASVGFCFRRPGPDQQGYARDGNQDAGRNAARRSHLAGLAFRGRLRGPRPGFLDYRRGWLGFRLR